MMNPWVILGVVLAIGGAYGVGQYRGDKAGQAKIQAQWDREKAELLAQHAAEQAKVREKEQGWQQKSDHLRQEKDREIRNISARATALANSLRDRQDRPAADAGGMPEAAGAGQAARGCTGADLYRPDGEFLVGEAARADQLRAALRQCYAQYEALSR